ncbi:MAG: M16 family metallopeptidase [Candidatus Woesearchaeota archaeon]
MIKKEIKNIKTIYKKKQTNLVSINISVLVGSSNEKKTKKGIAHFMEHMLFEGTTKRNCEELTNEIERLGGELNAYTTTERTNYFIKIHKNHSEKAFEILGDMICNPLFDEKAIKKEKTVVLGEIKMINDEPRHYQWVLLQKNIFKKNYSWPTYGTEKTVKSITKKDLIDFHSENYTKDNIIITIVGDCKKYKDYIEKNFKNLKSNKNKNNKLTKPEKILKSHKEKKKLKLKYIILGYHTVPRNHKDSYTLDVIHAILARGQSGKLFIEIRTKRGLGYELGIYHNVSKRFGYFAFYANAEKRNIKTIKKIFFNEIKKLLDPKQINNDTLSEAKSYIQGHIAIRNEDTQEEADITSFFEECNDKFDNYYQKIKKITKTEISQVVRKYLNNKHCEIIIE